MSKKLLVKPSDFIFDEVFNDEQNMNLLNMAIDNALDLYFDDKAWFNKDYLTNALVGRWGGYSLAIRPRFVESLMGQDDITTKQEQFDYLLGKWINRSFQERFILLIPRYKDIIEAYQKKIDWLDGVTSETTYNNVKDIDDGNNESTDFNLPNKAVSTPYGNPSFHNQGKNGNTHTKSGSVSTKGLVNPIEQRDRYVKLLHNAYEDLALEFGSLFITMDI